MRIFNIKLVLQFTVENVELQLLSHLESDTEVFDGRSMAHLCKAIEVPPHDVNIKKEIYHLPVMRRYTSPKGGGASSPSAVHISNMRAWSAIQ